MPPFKQAYHNTHEMEKQEADPSMHPGPLVLPDGTALLGSGGLLVAEDGLAGLNSQHQSQDEQHNGQHQLDHGGGAAPLAEMVFTLAMAV